MSRITRSLCAKRSASYGTMNGFAEEMFTGQKTILACAQEERISKKFSKINREAAEAYKNADGMGMRMGPAIGMISNFALAAIGMGSAVLYSRKFPSPINVRSPISSTKSSAPWLPRSGYSSCLISRKKEGMLKTRRFLRTVRVMSKRKM